MRLGLSAVSAIIVVFALIFLYQLIRQPRLIHDELTQRIVRTETVDRKLTMSNEIRPFSANFTEKELPFTIRS